VRTRLCLYNKKKKGHHIPNPRIQLTDASSSKSMHRQEHVQSIVTLRSRRQVDNQAVLPEENPSVPQGQESGNN